jgi:NADH-quinone oxidoreductase subunit N
MVVIVLLMVLTGKKEIIPYPIIMGLYLWFQLINECVVNQSISQLFFKSELAQLGGIFITFFAVFISFILKNKYEIKILTILLVIFLNLIISATNFMSFFICLEAASFTIFMLSVTGSKTTVKTEAAIKYFIVTAISSSIMLLSMGLLFLLVGSLNYSTIIIYYALKKKTYQLVIPLILLFCSLLLKIGLFPGHGWVADVAEGISYSTFLLINILLKLTLLIFMKITFFEIFPISILFIYIGILSYLIGTLVTLMQKKLIRFLAFGSISHVGFTFSLFYLTDAGI